MTNRLEKFKELVKEKRPKSPANKLAKFATPALADYMEHQLLNQDEHEDKIGQVLDMSNQTQLSVSDVDKNYDAMKGEPKPYSPAWVNMLSPHTAKMRTDKPSSFFVDAQREIEFSLDTIHAEQALGDAVLNGEGIANAYKSWKDAQEKAQLHYQTTESDLYKELVSFDKRLIFDNLRVAAPMLESYYEASPYMFGGALIGMGIATLVGWGVPAPEELLTVPSAGKVGAKAGFVVGTKLGATAGTANYWYRHGVGSFYGEMLSSGANPKISGIVAPIAAIPYAAIEYIQMRQLTPGLRKGVQQTIMRSVSQVLMQAGRQYGRTLVKEALIEEVLQEATKIAAVDVANYLSGNGIDLDREAFYERVDRMTATGLEAIKSMSLLPVSNAAVDIYTGVQNAAPSGARTIEEVNKNYDKRIEKAKTPVRKEALENLKKLEQQQLTPVEEAKPAPEAEPTKAEGAIKEAQKELAEARKPIPAIREGMAQADIESIEEAVEERTERITVATEKLQTALNEEAQQAADALEAATENIQVTNLAQKTIEENVETIKSAQEKINQLQQPIVARQEGQKQADIESIDAQLADRAERISEAEEAIDKAEKRIAKEEKFLKDHAQPINTLKPVKDELGKARKILQRASQIVKVPEREAPEKAAEAKPAPAQPTETKPAEPVGKQAQGKINISETILGGGSIGLDITKDGKLIAEMTFSINEEGIAKIGFIKAFGGRGSLSIADLKEAQRQAKEKFPKITKFTGDRVTKEALASQSKQAEAKPTTKKPIKPITKEEREELRNMGMTIEQIGKASPETLRKKLAAAPKKLQADPVVDTPAKGKPGFAGVPGRPKSETSKPWLTDDKVVSPNENMEAFFRRTQKFGSRKASSFLSKAKAAFVERFKFAPFIPDIPEAALARDIIRTMPEARRSAIEEAYEHYAKILDGDGSTQVLSKTGLDVYGRKIFVEDFIVEAEAGRDVPGGFSIEELRIEKNRLDDIISKVPSVRRAYQARQAFWLEVSKDLAERGVISEETAKNPHYVRHFVLKYMEGQQYAFTGRKKLREQIRVYGKKRVGTIQDVSTNILEVDTHALSQIYADNAIEDAANEIADKYNERPGYTQLAKSKNFENLVGGPEVVTRIEELKGLLATETEEDADIRAAWIEELTELDPTYPFRIKIAMFMSKLNKALGNKKDAEVTFAEMNAIIREDPKSSAALAAKGVFKHINERNRFIRAALGDKYLTAEKLAEADEYVEWWYKRPNIVYRAQTLDGSKIAELIEASAEESDELIVSKAMLKEALVLGGRRPGWIIPKWLAAQLDDLPANNRSGYMVDSLTKPFVKWWKRWILRVNPLRYNRRNLIGDSERLNASGRTHAFTRAGEAIKILWNKEGEIYNKARELGVIGTSLWHEMGTAHRQRVFARFKEAKDITAFQKATRFPKGAIRHVSAAGQVEQDLTQAREDILRLAVFLDALDDVDKFRAGKNTRYGPNIRHWAGWHQDVETMALEDRWRAAAKISRETMADYGDFTPWENDTLRQGLLPFYSWAKLNTKFWPHVIGQAAKEGTAGAPLVTASAKAGVNLGKVSARIFGIYALIYMWNHRDDEEELKEKALPEWIRTRPHLNIGDATLWEQTALSDFTEWFGVDDISGDLQRFDAGYITLDQLLKDTAANLAKAPANKVTQMLNPYLKAPVTALGYKTFPDVFKPRQFAQAWSTKAMKQTALEILGTDVKKFVDSFEGDITLEEALSYYFVGSMYRDMSPEELGKQIITGLQYTTRKRTGVPRKGREREAEILRARQKAVKELKRKQ